MGTVPTPADPAASSVLPSSSTHSWYQTHQFLLTPPACRVITNAAQTLVANVPLSILFGAKTLDNVQSGDSPMHSTTTNTDRIYIRTAGRYDVVGLAQFSSATGAISVDIFKNGVNVSQVAMPGPGGQASISIDDTIQCSAGDYLTLVVSNSVAGTINTTWPCVMYAKWVSI